LNASLAVASRGLHERLRSATADLHRAAEDAFASGERLTSMAGYVDLLDRLWSLHAGLEQAVALHAPGIFGLEVERFRRSPMLTLDLEAIAARAPRLTPVLVAFASPAAALGGLYVLEGSMLGGRVLLRRAQDGLGVTELHGARFLAGHGAATGQRWKQFLQVLALIPATGEDAEQAETGARATFAAFVGQLAGNGRLPRQPADRTMPAF
jgi:heme oxygenase